MRKYYDTVDTTERKKVRDMAKQKFQDIMRNHKKYLAAKEELDQEEAASGAAKIEEEKKNDAMSKLQEQEDIYRQLEDSRKRIDLNSLEPKEQEQATNDPEYRLFLESEAFLCKEGYKLIAETQAKRMPMAFVPNLRRLPIEDREGNVVYHTVVAKAQSDDVIKACRKIGTTAKTFSYDRQAWEEDKRLLTELKDAFDNKRMHLNQVATDLFQDSMVALMHLKVIRAYIEAVLRFGIEKQFLIGLVCPKRGAERQILNQLNNCLAEEHLREYYGEKMDA